MAKAKQRYQIEGEIASGDFATVYRGRDRELGRPVAVKKIHRQFLSDPKLLTRYWQEAQLLASLQHPHVITIHDLARKQGWLIMELMAGTVKDQIAKAPLGIDSTRKAILHTLRALKTLHTKGIVHGDVKPGNLLLDSRGRVKLGDFGLARRVDADDGSLLKGTTKYMAPETVSDQFGPVRPAADLYSLGFAAYEMLCGPNFEALFPGLGAFGRDRQGAWLMWHAAADRRLPPMDQVLEGVPEDLAYIVEKLSAKDPEQRYRSADAAIADLREHTVLGSAALPSRTEDAADEPEPPAKRRWPLYGALGVSLALTCAMLVLPGPGGARPEPAAADEPVGQGVVEEIDEDGRRILYEAMADGAKVKETYQLKDGDRLVLNDGDAIRLRDVRPGDRLTLGRDFGRDGRPVVRVAVSRPVSAEAKVLQVEPSVGRLRIAVQSGNERGDELALTLAPAAEITFNGRDAFEGHPVTLADVQADDRVAVDVAQERTGRFVTRMAVSRPVPLSGRLVGVDAEKGTVTVASSEAEAAQPQTWPVAGDVRVTLNGLPNVGGPLRLADLRVGDAVTATHDEQVRQVEAFRVFEETGTVRSVAGDAGVIVVATDRGEVTATAGAGAELTLAGEVVDAAALRAGDRVTFTHEDPLRTRPTILELNARRPVDPFRWALLISVSDYDDPAVAQPTRVAADTDLLAAALHDRYGVPDDQLTVLRNPSLVLLRSQAEAFLDRLEAPDEAIVYFAGNAVLTGSDEVHLAPASFSAADPAGTALPLQWLLDRLDATDIRRKLFMLDWRGPADPGVGLRDAGPDYVLSRKLGRVASFPSIAARDTARAERGTEAGDFAAAFLDVLRGDADSDGDGEPTAAEIAAAMRRSVSGEGPYVPTLHLPGTRAERLPAASRAAIDQLLYGAVAGSIDEQQADGLFAGLSAVHDQPEPNLAYALALMSDAQRRKSQPFAEAAVRADPAFLPARVALAWVHFFNRDYDAGVRQWAEILEALPQAGPRQLGGLDPASLYEQAGRLREFAVSADTDVPVSQANLLRLAQAIDGPQADAAFNGGRDAVTRIVDDYERQLAAAAGDAQKTQTSFQRRVLDQYAQPDYAALAAAVRERAARE